MTTTEPFQALAQSWGAFTEHWRFTGFLSFLFSLFAYLFGAENRELLVILLTMGLIDTILGSILALVGSRFNARGMGKGIIKVILYGCFLIIFHLAKLTIDGATGFSASLLDLIAYFFLIIREGKSANEKLAKFSIVLPFNPFLHLEKIMNSYAEEFERVDKK